MSKLIITAVLAAAAATASASFDSYIIRNGASGSPTIQTNNTYVPGATEFVISQSGMKAGLGSNDVNGLTLGQVTSVGITRHDDSTRFNAGSGPAVAPYFNLWVTDGNGNYAVLANEPSNPSFAAFRTDLGNGSFSYQFSFADIGAERVQVYETANGGYNSTNTWVHNLLGNNGPLTFSDVLGLEIAPPPPAYIAGGNGVGSGAPRELSTNDAYGFNWIFGDTLANYVSGNEGYVVSNAFAVPAPGAMAVLGLGGLAAARRRRA